MSLLSAREYLDLLEKGIDPFAHHITKQKSESEDEKDYFEKLGELVEQHPIGRP